MPGSCNSHIRPLKEAGIIKCSGGRFQLYCFLIVVVPLFHAQLTKISSKLSRNIEKKFYAANNKVHYERRQRMRLVFEPLPDLGPIPDDLRLGSEGELGALVPHGLELNSSDEDEQRRKNVIGWQPHVTVLPSRSNTWRSESEVIGSLTNTDMSDLSDSMSVLRHSGVDMKTIALAEEAIFRSPQAASMFRGLKTVRDQVDFVKRRAWANAPFLTPGAGFQDYIYYIT